MLAQKKHGKYNYIMSEIRGNLMALADKDYKAFSEKLVLSSKPLIGVRLPHLKKIAKALAKDFENSFCDIKTDYFEEVMLKGFVIAYAKMSLTEKFGYIEKHIEHIDNWSCCDSFCAAFKFREYEKRSVFEFIKKFIHDENEFKVRFSLVMLLDHFIEEKYTDEIFDMILCVKHAGYYVKMAVSWLISICFIKQREKTLALLKNNNLDTFIHNKAIQKCRESLRVSKEDKELLLLLKK